VTVAPAEPPADRGPRAPGPRTSWPAFAALGILAALIMSVVIYRVLTGAERPAITVRTIVPSPTSVYRWFAAETHVEAASGGSFTFPAGGRVAEILPAGSRFAAGDVLALLEGGRRARGELAHHRERLAYYEQMRETMSAQNNRGETRQAELKIAEKKRLIAEAQEALAKTAVVAGQAGEVAEAQAAVGATVKPGDPAVRAKGGAFRAIFELSREDSEKARNLGFCRVELEGKPVDCALGADGGDETHVVIELPGDPAVAAGRPLRLARARHDAVFALPPSAIVRVGDSDRVYVAAPSGRAEMRVVALADRTDAEALVKQGIDVGDQVIVDVPRDLRPDARVQVAAVLRQ
jgi:multidrug efflux pump subunit AcrA (membrane-fusion protein)